MAWQLQVQHSGLPNETTRHVEQARRAWIERVFRRVVRSARWIVDPQKSSTTLQLELGSRGLEGVVVRIMVSNDGRSIEIESPAGAQIGRLRERLERRLSSRGYVVSVK